MTDKIYLTPSFKIAAHLMKIVGDKRWERILETDFAKAVAGASLEPRQIDILNHRKTGSVEEFKTEGNLSEDLLHTFLDCLKKRSMLFKFMTPEDKRQNLLELAVFSLWNIENFRIIFAGQLNADKISYPAKPKELLKFSSFYTYLEQTILPGLKERLRLECGMLPHEFNQLMTIMSNEFRHGVLEGIDILKPISGEDWQAAYSQSASIPVPA